MNYVVPKVFALAWIVQILLAITDTSPKNADNERAWKENSADRRSQLHWWLLRQKENQIVYTGSLRDDMKEIRYEC
jgi:hypothetical protein